MRADELVLVVPTRELYAVGFFIGFNPNVEPYLRMVYDNSKTSFRPRGEVEDDPDYQQLIPYVIFQSSTAEDDRPLLYRYYRGPQQGDPRLQRLASLGVGGHINPGDAADSQALSIFEAGLAREIREEVELPEDQFYTPPCVGVLNLNETPVDRVHLGFVYVYRLDYPQLKAREAGLSRAGFVPVAECYRQLEEFERWSVTCLQQLYPAAQNVRDMDLVGLTENRAATLAATAGMLCRVTEPAGRMLTLDFNPERINLEVVEDIVIGVYRG